MPALALAPSSGRNDHLAEECEDEFCTRLPCRMFKAGRQMGYRDGWDECYPVAFMDGEAAGFSAGFAAGTASATGGGG